MISSLLYWLPIVDDQFIIESQPISSEMNIHEQATTFAFIKSIDLFSPWKEVTLRSSIKFTKQLSLRLNF